MAGHAREEAALARVREAGANPDADASRRALRDVLRGREARAIAKAAAVAAEHDLVALRDDLAGALDRLLNAAYKADPGCAAKAALAEALDRLGHGDADLFQSASRHVQWEPVWGGRVDTAVDLRGAAAMALARLDRPDCLVDLARLLADPEPGVRVTAARALAFRGGQDGLPLLHLRIHVRDPEPRVLGACFEAALRLAPAGSTEFVAAFLDAPDVELAEEAALALGASRRDEALAALREWMARAVEPVRRRVGLRALALMRREDAFDLLLERVRDGTAAAACEALEALAALRDDEALVVRVRGAADTRTEAEVRRAWTEAFGRAAPGGR